MAMRVIATRPRIEFAKCDCEFCEIFPDDRDDHGSVDGAVTLALRASDESDRLVEIVEAHPEWRREPFPIDWTGNENDEPATSDIVVTSECASFSVDYFNPEKRIAERVFIPREWALDVVRRNVGPVGVGHSGARTRGEI